LQINFKNILKINQSWSCNELIVFIHLQKNWHWYYTII